MPYMRLSYDSAIDFTVPGRKRNDHTFIFTDRLDNNNKYRIIYFFNDDQIPHILYVGSVLRIKHTISTLAWKNPFKRR